MQIRNASADDLEQIVTIYNQAVARKNCTADTVPLTSADRREWFDEHDHANYPIFVMEGEHREDIWGWCSLSAYRKGRLALRHVAEISYYVEESRQQQGIGSQLIQHALSEAPAYELHNLFAILLDINRTSVSLLERNGFTRWGHLPEIAEFPDMICGQFIYGLKIR